MMDKLNVILKENKMGELKKGNLKIDSKEIQNGKDLAGIIEEFNAREGWICLTGEIVLIDVSAGKEFNQAILPNQTILSGELTKDAQSLHIRQNGAAWTIWYLTKEDNGNQLFLEEAFHATPKAPGYKLKYETFWQENETLGVLQPFASRFAGFEKGGKTT